MRKIPTLFVRQYEQTPYTVINEVRPECAWAQTDKGVIATEKVDGTCCMFDGQAWHKRQSRKLKYKKKGGGYTDDDYKPAPHGWIACMDKPDAVTGDWPGWVRIVDGNPSDIHHNDAIKRTDVKQAGTYELIGEKVQGNPYGLSGHHLVKHGDIVVTNCPTDYEGIQQFLTEYAMEGIVFYHPDGCMAKIKSRDFGIEWPHERLTVGTKSVMI